MIQNNENQAADGRVVQAIRKLKRKEEESNTEMNGHFKGISSNIPKNIKSTIEVSSRDSTSFNSKDQKENRNSNNKVLLSGKHPSTQQKLNNSKKILKPISSKNCPNISNLIPSKIPAPKTQDSSKINSSSQIQAPVLRKNSQNHFKISVDGSLSKPKISVKKQFDYETLKKYKKKPKTEFQKNILSPANVEKYKEEFVGILKKDKEFSSKLSELGIPPNVYKDFITNTFFLKPHFLVALEMLILEDIEESSTLKVFRTNKNVLPLKVVKENYFKEEINKYLNNKKYVEEYKLKQKEFRSNIDKFIDSVHKFEVKLNFGGGK